MNNEYGIVGCEHCGELVNRNILNDDNICPECLKIIATDKRRGDRSNQLCLTCTKRCKQDSLVNIITCPLYTPK